VRRSGRGDDAAFEIVGNAQERDAGTCQPGDLCTACGVFEVDRRDFKD
jgi:hypothetical protein